MTDAPFDVSAFAGDDDELTFDDPVPAPAKKGRAPRKGRAKAEKAEPAEPAAPIPAPAANDEADPFDFAMFDAAPAPAPAPASVTADEPLDDLLGDFAAAPPPAPPPAASPAPEPFDAALFDDAPAPAPKPIVAKAAPAAVAEEAPAPAAGPMAGLARHLFTGMAALSCVASLASLGAVVTVGRTLAAAQADRAAARDEREALARLPATLAAIDAASKRLAAAPTSPGVSADELKRSLDGLRLSLGARQPDGLAPLAGMTRGGFSEVATRLDRIEARLDGATRGPRAPRGPYQAPPS